MNYLKLSIDNLHINIQKYMWRPRMQNFDPHKSVSKQSWWKLPNNKLLTNINAVVELNPRQGQRIVAVFCGRQYHTFNVDQKMKYESSSPITSLGLPSYVEKIDAIFKWGRNQFFYVFSGRQFWKLNRQLTKTQDGYPRLIDVWSGVGYHLDTAFTDFNGED